MALTTSSKANALQMLHGGLRLGGMFAYFSGLLSTSQEDSAKQDSTQKGAFGKYVLRTGVVLTPQQFLNKP
jgi:hypothetical protein